MNINTHLLWLYEFEISEFNSVVSKKRYSFFNKQSKKHRTLRNIQITREKHVPNRDSLPTTQVPFCTNHMSEMSA